MSEKKRTLSMRRNKEGYTDFYYGYKKVTALWMDFFAGLSFKQENKCGELFIKKYGKKLYPNG